MTEHKYLAPLAGLPAQAQQCRHCRAGNRSTTTSAPASARQVVAGAAAAEGHGRQPEEAHERVEDAIRQAYRQNRCRREGRRRGAVHVAASAAHNPGSSSQLPRANQRS